MKVSEFDFDLPDGLIASHPLPERDASRMLVVSPSLRGSVRAADEGDLPSVADDPTTAPLLEGGTFQNKHIRDFVSYLRPGDVVVFNNSKVIPARFDARAADGAVYEITLHTSAGYPLPCGEVDLGALARRAGGGLNNESSNFKVQSEKLNSENNINKPAPRRAVTAQAPPSAREGVSSIWWGFAKKFQKFKIGDRLNLDDGTEIVVLDKNDTSGLLIEFLLNTPTQDFLIPQTSADKKIYPAPQGGRKSTEFDKNTNTHSKTVFDVLDRVGKMPLPPYIKREQDATDRERYQNVYADPVGSMAAPTAGLHFTPELLDAIRATGAEIVNITLHVGAGTWLPIKTDDTDNHHMHSEWGVITSEQADIINAAHENGGRVIAIGTTSLRLLESAAQQVQSPKYKVQSFCGTTDIFITPGYRFRVVDVLLTNFHLPKSTLFMLVSAFAGLPEMKAAYAHAVAEKYRFFSYGDCCLLFRKD